MREDIKKRIEAVRCGEVPEGYHKDYCLMPIEWNSTELKNIAKKVSQKNRGGEDVAMLSNSAVRGVVLQREYFEKDIANNENTDGYFVVEPGDYIYNPRISVNAPFGPIKRNNLGHKGIVSPLYTVFRPKKGEFVDERYLEYFFLSTQWNRFVYTVSNQGVRFDRMNITDDDFFCMSIAVPPLAEQQKIAEILATCDRVIELKQKLLEEKRRQKQWLMQKLLDPNSGQRVLGFDDEWQTGTFIDVCTFINGRAYKQDELLEKGKYQVLRVGNLFTKSEWYYSDLELLPQMYIDNGDLIYAWSASFGPRIWEGGKVIYHYHIWKVIPGEKVCKEYLYQYFLYDVELLTREQQGGIMSHITKETMEKRPCRYPSVLEQRKIAGILQAADQEIVLAENDLEAWRQKKKALMQLLLTGLVRVNA